MASDLLSGVITDWGGFERLVAEINRTATDVRVEHNAIISDRFGVPRQIDVALRYKKGLVDHLDVCECKYWNSNVDRGEVDKVVMTVQQLNASRGIIFTTRGFQSGAIDTAAANGILLFKVREPTPGEWGAPGRMVDFYLTGCHRAVAELQPIAFAHAPHSDKVNLELRLGPGGSETAILYPLTGKLDTVENVLMETSLRVGQQFVSGQYAPRTALFDGGSGCRLFRTQTRALFPSPAHLVDQPAVFLTEVRYALGIGIHQKRMIIDRAKNYTFAVSLEDCVNGDVTLAARRNTEVLTSLFAYKEPTTEVTSDALSNGTIITYWVSDIQQFDEFATIGVGEIRDTIDEVNGN